MLRKFLKENIDTIRKINKKYRTPRIEMSGAVKLSLLTLRIYLVFLVGLLIFKFITLLK